MPVQKSYRAITFIAACLLILTSVAQSAELKGSAKHCSVPPGFKISDGADLPPELKNFLGYFSGDWGIIGTPHTLLVAEVFKDGGAVVYYAWEAYPDWNVFDSGCRRLSAKIEGNTLIVHAGRKRVYVLTDSETLEGEYDFQGNTVTGTFKKHD